MKWKFAARMAMFVTQLLGIKEIPIENSAVKFTEDQEKKLKSVLDEESDFDQLVDSFNKDIAMAEKSTEAQQKLKAELKNVLKEANFSESETNKLVEGAEDENQLTEILAGVRDEMKAQKTLIEKLVNDPEAESPEGSEEDLKSKIVKHSATHLFGDKSAYNAFEGRNWNRQAAGMTTSSTDFTEGATIEKLNGDLDLYFRENPDKIKSLQRDRFGLPSFWPKRLNVDDKVADGTIATAEITQARKLPWLPKNKQLIKPEEGQIFPAQIDIEFVGYYLQKIEASWLNMMNKEGSQPYKTAFVGFLVAELDKKARVEDRIALIKAVYVETPENATAPGKFINRLNGLLYQFYKAREITKKYKAFSLGTPTTSNIVDYVDQMIESLPLDIRRTPGLVLYLSPYWLKSYKRRYEQLHGTNTDYKGYPEHPKDYNNIKFEAMPDMEGLDFMFITFDDNIEILENVPKEKSMYHFEYLKRIIYIWADYKLGIRLIHIGNKIQAGDPLEFQVQTVWSNDVPIFPSDFAIPVFDDGTGELDANFGHLKVDAAWTTTPVQTINNAKPGQIIKIQGNADMAATKNVTSAGNIDMGAAFDLKTGGTLTLFVLEDGTIKEVNRTTAPPVAPSEDQSFDTATLDVASGTVFNFTGVADTTLADILNGVEGKEITIYGTDTVDVELTVDDVAGKIDMASTAVLASSADLIKLVNVGGVWYESARTIA